MESITKLFTCLESRAEYLKQKRETGQKVIGIVGYGYLPEELIYSLGAIPQRLIRGGSQQGIDDSREFCHNCFSTFHKAQIGYLMKESDPLYSQIDHLVLESSDENTELTGMYVRAHKTMPMTWLGIPGNPQYEGAFPYFFSSLQKLIKELEILTGNELSQQKLAEYTELYNEIRSLLGKISELRKAPSPSISGLEFVKLNHASYYCEPHEYLDMLQQVYTELDKADGAREGSPRIAIFGCPIALGDYSLLEIIENAGGMVVVEELSGSTRYYQSNTPQNGDLMESLAKRYYSKKFNDVYSYPWGEELPAMYNRLVDEFNVDGVIWYQLMYMHAQSMLGYVVSKRMKQVEVPVMTLQSEYDIDSRVEAVKTRVETFMEVVKQSKRKKGQ